MTSKLLPLFQEKWLGNDQPMIEAQQPEPQSPWSEQIEFLKQTGGMTHLDRERWSLSATARIRELIGKDLHSRERERILASEANMHTRTIHLLNEVDSRSYRRLGMMPARITPDPACNRTTMQRNAEQYAKAKEARVVKQQEAEVAFVAKLLEELNI